jgi:hypothetical protein
MQKTFVLAAAALGAALAADAAEARIVEIKVEKVEPLAGGVPLGPAGAYERVVGTARGELDPLDPRNAGIVNLDKAARNADGKVGYQVEFFLLRPSDPRAGNRKILFEVTNRGRKFLFNWLMDAPPSAAGTLDAVKEAKDAGNALFLRQGYTILWTGWDPDAPKANGGMVIKVPAATADGAPIVRTIRDELVSGTRGPEVQAFKLSYEAATLDKSLSSLTVRRHVGDKPAPVPPEGWAFADARTIKLLPEGTKPAPGLIYDLRYPAKNPWVLGIGFAATRDLVSFLRREAKDQAGNANPAGAGIQTALAVGISQSGRYLRDFIGQGFNRDEGNRRVFDGVLSHIAGVGRVFLNAEFGQPARTNTQHEDHFYPENAFPFAAARTTDPVSGRSGMLLRGDRFDPKLIEVNTSTEYWQKGASLLHTDPLGGKDLDLPANTRVYLVAGTQHGGRFGSGTAPGPCANPRNPHSAGPPLRALIVALDRWVTAGEAPPPSLVPRLSDGTLVEPQGIGFPAIPGAAVARAGNEIAPYGDWVAPYPDKARAYRVLVAQVDGDGNETAGIRTPDIAVPLGTYTGWNLYKEPFPAGALCDRDGSFLAFARTKAERAAKGDPRPSLEERYGNHAAYVAKVEAAANELVRARLLLAEDAALYVAAAKAKDPFKP